MTQNGCLRPSIGEAALAYVSAGYEQRYCSRRRFLAGLAGAAGLMLSGREAPALGPSIITERSRLDDKNHLFITTALHDRYLAKVVTARAIVGKTFATTPEILAATGAYACFNGSFFEGDGSPSGLFVVDGLLEKPIVYGKGDGVLYIDRRRQIHIISKYHFSDHRDKIVDALQVNIFTEGDLKLYQDKEYKKKVPRNLIGISPEGIVDVIYKNTNFTYGDRYMRLAHGCTVVAALDGGGSASAVDKLGRSSYCEAQGDRREDGAANFIVLYER
jgi:hypothetical protein